jgi:hypothetical protein
MEGNDRQLTTRDLAQGKTNAQRTGGRATHARPVRTRRPRAGGESTAANRAARKPAERGARTAATRRPG